MSKNTGARYEIAIDATFTMPAKCMYEQRPPAPPDAAWLWEHLWSGAAVMVSDVAAQKRTVPYRYRRRRSAAAYS
jgi:hypothetical protein